MFICLFSWIEVSFYVYTFRFCVNMSLFVCTGMVHVHTSFPMYIDPFLRIYVPFLRVYVFFYMYRKGSCTYIVFNVYRSLFMYIRLFVRVQVPFYFCRSFGMYSCLSPFIHVCFVGCFFMFVGIILHGIVHVRMVHMHTSFSMLKKKKSFLIVYTSLAMCTQAAFYVCTKNSSHRNWPF